MERTYREDAREIPVFAEKGVLVAGGGPAGIAAAVAAARNGADTLLIERFGFLGGTATAALMLSINGFRNQKPPSSIQTVRGIAEEMMIEAARLGGLSDESSYEQAFYDIREGELKYSYTVDSEVLKYVALRMAVDAGVQILFHTYVSDAVVEEDVVKGVVVETKSGRGAILARVTVDATGDGDVAARAGCSYTHFPADHPHAMGLSLMYRLGGIDRGEAEKNQLLLGDTVNLWGPGTKADGVDLFDLSRAEVETRLALPEAVERQRARPGFVDAYLVESPVQVGVRQTRFVEGEYTLTTEDALAGTIPEDSVAMSSCPIIQFYGYRRYLEHEGFGIPYRCLLPRGVEGLLLSGRCISSEQQPWESFRAMAPIMAIGQASGTAAALAAEEGKSPAVVNVARLQSVLTEQNQVVSI